MRAPSASLLRGAFRLLSTSPPVPRKQSLRTLRASYNKGEPITVLTAYDYPSALHADLAGVQCVLVGDSVGMVVLGHRTTQPVTIADMIHHTRAARRGVASALLVADLPFGSYERSPAQAVDTALQIIKETGADAVKLEGGVSRQKSIAAIADAGIAVFGHVGLMPQAVSNLGGFRAMGRTSKEAICVLDDARAVQDAGAFALVVECVPNRVADVVTKALDIPTIGIGSGNACSGQVLVYHDMLGILNHPHHAKVAPKFSKQFAGLASHIHEAILQYCSEVKQRDFPDKLHSPYRIPDEEFEQFLHDADKSLLKNLRGRQTKGAETESGKHGGSEATDGISLY
ncbi:unnamed protein product [Chondrus crispus]|uniref:3-methyl-2-oxobutanoate hydroxymethyltransferase n=1 Tax=Chondrus crispus TaxID=2769 RepID=R7Q6G9_CHOCR|nr:unnamed protein product [Chondrus crispus]CDF33050.1 unnamed protein product [Chondrus crispus]|eukprot:XP_005712853.1 unnamed protein product [Chondrus crispus]